MTIDNFIEWFHEDKFKERIKPVFNTVQNFLKVVKSKGRESQIDIGYIPIEELNEELFDYLGKNGFLENVVYKDLPDEFRNLYLLWWTENKPEEAYQYICDNILLDVTKSGNDYWMYLSSREDLDVLFYDSTRGTSARDVARQVLNGDWVDWFNDTTYDIYEDVIEDLDEANTVRLAEYILKAIGNQDLNSEDYSSDFFHELAEVQAREGFFQITSEDVYSLIKDKEAMNELLNDELNDLKYELRGIHYNAYNTAFNDELYDSVMYGLSEFFTSNFDERQVKVGDKVSYRTYIRIRDFKNVVREFLSETKIPSYYDVLEYWGRYEGVLKELMDRGVYEKIDFRVPDYPDYGKVIEYVNDGFRDNI